MEIKYRMNFYKHWFKNYGYIYVIKNFIKIGNTYNTFRDICVKNDIFDIFEVFFSTSPKNQNRFFNVSAFIQSTSIFHLTIAFKTAELTDRS